MKFPEIDRSNCLPEYLDNSLDVLHSFSKKLDEVSGEIRTVEKQIQNCGICLNFIHVTVVHDYWVRGKDEPHEWHFRRVTFLGWLEHQGKFRLVHGEAEQGCDALESGRKRPRTSFEDFSISSMMPLIETKAQVRLAAVGYLPAFVTALTSHVDVSTGGADDIPF